MTTGRINQVTTTRTFTYERLTNHDSIVKSGPHQAMRPEYIIGNPRTKPFAATKHEPQQPAHPDSQTQAVALTRYTTADAPVRTRTRPRRRLPSSRGNDIDRTIITAAAARYTLIPNAGRDSVTGRGHAGHIRARKTPRNALRRFLTRDYLFVYYSVDRLLEAQEPRSRAAARLPLSS